MLLGVLLVGLAPNTSLGFFVGEPASPLVVKEWVKGGPVEVKPGTNIFVVEIWNTTGVASRAAITNLNRLQNHFKTNGVVVVGVSDEPVETIQDFMQHGGTNIEYAVAADLNRRTSMAYMEPAGQFAVPYAFVVGTNGNLLWHGHVLHGLDQAVAHIIAGVYDVDRGKKLDVAEHQMQQYLALARRSDARTRAAGMVLLAARTNDLDLLCQMAFEITTAPKIAKRDFALANVALNQAEKLAPTNSAQVMIYRSLWLFQGGKRDAGLLLATQAVACARSPEEKANVQSLLATMEARQAVIKDRQSQTNRLNEAEVPAPSPASGTATNRMEKTAPPPGTNSAAKQP